MFSLLNHFYLHNNDDLLNNHKDFGLHSFRRPTFFTLFKIDPYSKRYNTFDTINMVTVAYNMPNFIYKYYLKSDYQKGVLVRNFYDYLMHNGNIILSDYSSLDYSTDFFYREFDVEHLEKIADFEEYDADNDLYNNYVYTYFFRNFLIMVGKQVLKDEDRYDESIRLSTTYVTLDLKNVIYEIMRRFESVLLNKYKKNLTTEKANAIVNVIYPIYQIAQRYMMEHLDLSVNYVYKEKVRVDYDRDYESDCEDYNDEDCYDYYDDYGDYDDEYNEESYENIRYVNNLHLLFLLDYGARNLIFKANFKYWIEEIFGEDENGIIIPADPFTLDVVIFKVGNNIKILLNVIIEKKVEKLHKVSISEARVLNAERGNIRYSIKEDNNFYVIKIYDEFKYEEDQFFVNLSSYFNDISNHMDRIFAFSIIR